MMASYFKLTTFLYYYCDPYILFKPGVLAFAGFPENCFCLGDWYKYMCVSAPSALITSAMIRALYDWLNKFYSFYMAAVVSVVSTCSLTIEFIVETKLIRLSYVALYIHFKSHCLKYL